VYKKNCVTRVSASSCTNAGVVLKINSISGRLLQSVAHAVNIVKNAWNLVLAYVGHVYWWPMETLLSYKYFFFCSLFIKCNANKRRKSERKYREKNRRTPARARRAAAFAALKPATETLKLTAVAERTAAHSLKHDGPIDLK